MNTDQLEQPQPTVDQPQGPTESVDSGEQSDVSLRRYRHDREGGRPPLEDRKPYAHADAPFESDRWQPSEPAPRGGFQRRIDKLTREKADLERRLAERQGATSSGQQFESIEEMTTRVIREAAERERATEQQRGRQASEPQRQQHQASSDKYTAELRRVKATNPDFDQVFAGFQIPNYIHDQLLRMEKGAEVAYALAKNRQALNRILELNEKAFDRAGGNVDAADFSEAVKEFEAFARSHASATQQAPQADRRQQHHLANAEDLRQRLVVAARADRELGDALKNPMPPVPSIIYPAILDTANSFDVAVYLTKHPEMQKRITTLWQTSGDAVFQATRNQAAAVQAAGLAVIREVHRISAALEFGTTVPARPIIERPVSQAPPPITPVAGGGSISQDDGDREGSDIDLARYRSVRNRQRNPRRG